MNNDGRGSGGAEQVRYPRKRGHVERPVLGPVGSRSTQQFDGQHPGAVKVSAVLVDVTREQVDKPVSTVPDTDSDDAVGVTSLADAGTPSLTDDGVASLADLAGGVNLGATFPVATGAAAPAVAGVASLADARAAPLADLAGDVTIGVTSLADAGVLSLANLAGSVAVRVTLLTVPIGVVADG